MYRKENNGARTVSAFNVWKRNGGKDHPNYAGKWKRRDKKKKEEPKNSFYFKSGSCEVHNHYHYHGDGK